MEKELENQVEVKEETTQEVEDSLEESKLDDNVDFSGDEKGDTKEVESASKKQSKSRNAWYAQQRKAIEEEKARMREEIRKEETLKAIKNVNPYTSEEIKTDADYKLFLQMREMENKGYNPIDDFIKFQHDKLKDEEKSQIAQKESLQKTIDDINDFKAKNPNVDLDQLNKDTMWQNYTFGKLGNVPLSDMYANYQAMRSQIEQEVRASFENAKLQEQAKELSSVQVGTSVVEEVMSREQMARLTPSQLASDPNLFKRYMEAYNYYKKN